MTKNFVRSMTFAAALLLSVSSAQAVILTSFEVPNEGDTTFTAAGGEIGWTRTTTGTAPHAQEGVRARANITGGPFVPAINATPPDGSKVYLSRAGATGGLGETLTFDTVSVAAGDALQLKYFASATSWEAGDILRITLGLSDSTTATLIDIAGGTTPNQVDAVEGVWRTLTYTVPAGITSAQLVIQTSSNSSVGDEGFAFDQYERTIPPPPVNPPSLFALTAANNFESDAVGVRERIAAGFPNANAGEPLAFRGTYTGNTGVVDHAANGGHQIQLNNGRLGNGDATTGTTAFQFDPVNVSGQPGVLVELDVRTEGRTSGFEAADELHIFVEGSSDGVNYTLLGTLADLVGTDGVNNDGLDALDSDAEGESDEATGTWTHLSQSLATSGLTHVRLVVDADVDSANEFIMLDNVSISAVPEPGSFVLAGLGLLGIVIGLRGRRQA